MSKSVFKWFAIAASVLFLSLTVLELESEARAGGGRSGGSRGSRSYSAPQTTQPSTQTAPTPQLAPSPVPSTPYSQQPAGGGFLRGMGGGILGGLLGGMLFSSLGFAGTGGLGGSGIGLFEIILVAGIGYLIFRMVKTRREENYAYQGANTYGGGSLAATYDPPVRPEQAPAVGDRNTGLMHIRQFDPSFDESRFRDAAMDTFFKVQGAWMNRDLATAGDLLTDEMRRIFQDDVDRMLREKTFNRMENVAVRNVEITEAWQEAGQDFVTVLIYANLLDYTVKESGEIIAGSKTEPVKFEEYWTLTRPVGNNPWKLSAIHQV